jgi:hypothetical protein
MTLLGVRNVAQQPSGRASRMQPREIELGREAFGVREIVVESLEFVESHRTQLAWNVKMSSTGLLRPAG